MLSFMSAMTTTLFLFNLLFPIFSALRHRWRSDLLLSCSFLLMDLLSGFEPFCDLLSQLFCIPCVRVCLAFCFVFSCDADTKVLLMWFYCILVCDLCFSVVFFFIQSFTYTFKRMMTENLWSALRVFILFLSSENLCLFIIINMFGLSRCVCVCIRVYKYWNGMVIA